MKRFGDVENLRGSVEPESRVQRERLTCQLIARIKVVNNGAILSIGIWRDSILDQLGNIMPTAGKPRENTSDERARELIGKAVIEGLLVPRIGGLVLASTYTQTDGGYWQDGGTHSQGSGDYHQGSGAD